MSNRQKIFLISGIIVFALVALAEGIFILRQSGLADHLPLAFDRALATLIGSRNDSSLAKNQFNAQEDMILQETAEDLERMQNQINHLFYEMTRAAPFAPQNIGRQESRERQNQFQPPDSIRRLQAEIAHIFQRAHESRHNSVLHLIDQGWDNVGEISSMNMEEDETNYVVTVSMPGFERTNINVSLNGRVLAVEAVVAHQQTAQDYRTAGSGCFKTQIMLPNDIAGESAQAFYRDGTLKITVSKKPAGNSLARKIKIM